MLLNLHYSNTKHAIIFQKYRSLGMYIVLEITRTKRLILSYANYLTHVIILNETIIQQYNNQSESTWICFIIFEHIQLQVFKINNLNF